MQLCGIFTEQIRQLKMLFITDEEIRALLNWKATLKAIEVALKAETLNKATPAQRTFVQILNTPRWMITMPGYLEDDQYGGWVCKILTGNPENLPGPTTNGSMMYFDQQTGAIKAVMGAVEITNWRTAAASAIATKYLYMPKAKSAKILAIFGCGDQGKAHAECFNNCFEFEEIRLWNRTTPRAINLSKELNKKYNTEKFRVFEGRESCARGADIIITATSPGNVPLVKHEWLKNGIHINAIGVVGSSVSEKHYELDKETYKHANVYVDNWAGSKKELVQLKTFGTEIKAEIGEVILGKAAVPEAEQLTVFQSLGMASEDAAMARLIYDLYPKK